MACELCNGRKKIIAPWEEPDVYEGYKLAQRIPCPSCNPEEYEKAINVIAILPTIAGRTLEEWKTLARQDNCLDLMVPSDLREILSKVKI